MKLRQNVSKAVGEPQNGEPRIMPIVQSTTFKYGSSDEMGALFDLEKEGYFYSRLANPTNDWVAKKICDLEGGYAAMLTGSGQSANFYAVFNICEAGDHFISTSAIYGGTFNLFGVTMKKLGIDVTFVEPDATKERYRQRSDQIQNVYLERLLPIQHWLCWILKKFADIAHKNGVPFIVDNTFATPINCRPFEFGVDIVTHATTKYMDGHAMTIGGCIVDSGNFDWTKYADKFPGLTKPDESYHGVVYTEKFGKMAYIQKATAQIMRDLGSVQSPMNAFLINIGLETLHLRVPRHCENALKVAQFLESNEHVAVWVNYADLPSNKYHELQQ